MEAAREKRMEKKRTNEKAKSLAGPFQIHADIYSQAQGEASQAQSPLPLCVSVQQTEEGCSEPELLSQLAQPLHIHTHVITCTLTHSDAGKFFGPGLLRCTYTIRKSEENQELQMIRWNHTPI